MTDTDNNTSLTSNMLQNSPIPLQPYETMFSAQPMATDGPILSDSTFTDNWLPSYREHITGLINDKLIVNFNPSLFILVMGTGMCCSILEYFPYPSHWLHICGIVMFGFAVFYFIVTFFGLLASLILHPKRAHRYNNDPQVALYISCLPMGFTTLVNFLHVLTKDSWVTGIWVLWWIAFFGSLYTACVTVFFSLICKHKGEKNSVEIKDCHAILLLPVVTLTVVASSGASISPSLPSLNHQIITLTLSYFSWSIAMAMGFNMILSLYATRLFTAKAPPTRLVFTSFLPVGITGQAAYGIMLLGHDVFDLIYEHRDTLLSSPYMSHLQNHPQSESALIALIIGNIILYLAAAMSLFLIGFAFYMTILAVFTCLSKIKPFAKHPNQELCYFPENPNWFNKRFTGLIKYNQTFWTMTFPLGTVSMATGEFYRVFNGFEALRVVAAMYGVTVLIITICCIFGITYRVVRALLIRKPVEPKIKEMV